MKQKAGVLVTMGFLLILCASMCAQGVQPEPAPALPSGVLGPDLIAWSQMQTPRPVPQPLPPDQNPRAQQQATAEVFAGMIVKIDARYVLKMQSGITYRLDQANVGQYTVGQYEGKQVRLAGNLDANRNQLHVITIELVS
jgi:hypothetical protein